MPEQKHVTTEQCVFTHKGVQRTFGLIISMLSLLMVATGWTLWTGYASASKAEAAAYKLESFAAAALERNERLDERNAGVSASISRIEAGQEKLSDKIDRLLKPPGS